MKIYGFGILSMGYGLPSTQPPDEGSSLGQFWYWIVGGDESLAEQLTRGTLALLLALAFIPIVFMYPSELPNYLFSVVFLVLSHVTIVTWRN